jgi:hypothetical protein
MASILWLCCWQIALPRLSACYVEFHNVVDEYGILAVVPCSHLVLGVLLSVKPSFELLHLHNTQPITAKV